MCYCWARQDHTAYVILVCKQVEKARAIAAAEACTKAQAEVSRLNAKLAEGESEMRALLTAVEHQKAVSAAKMRQLASFLTDMG